MLWLVTALALGATPSPRLQQLATGHFVAALPPERMQAPVDAAVEATVASIPWAFRAYVRRRLAVPARWCRTWTLQLDDHQVSCRCDHWAGPVVRPLAGPAAPVTNADGETFQVTVITGPSELTLGFSGEIGDQIRTFRFDERGGMEVVVIVSNPRLEPLHWTLPYKRAEGEPR